MKKIKTYETLHGNLNTIVRMGEKKVRIRFISRDNIHGYYTTANSDLQDAIEQDIDYGRLFDLYQETGYTDQPTETRPIEEIVSWQAARELLRKEPYLVPANRLRSPTSIEKPLAKKASAFPISPLKKERRPSCS